MRLATFWHKMLRFFFEEKFSTLAALNAVSDITPCAAQKCQEICNFFCYDYSEDVLALHNFRKKISAF